MEPILHIKDLVVHYITEEGIVHALRGINLVVNKEEIIGIAGETGSGKTTLALSIMRLLPTSARIIRGQIIFRGKDLLSLSEEEMRKLRQSHISLIMQGTSDVFNPLMLTGLQVSEAMEFHKDEPFHKAIQETKRLFSEVGLGTRVLVSLPHELSVGMRQRVKIALAISTQPELIVADEPFTGLDPTLQAYLSNLIMNLHSMYGFSALIISHNLLRLFEISSKIAILYAGKIIEMNDTSNIYHYPVHPYTKGLIGALPNIKSPKSKKLIEMPEIYVNPLNPPKGCVFWPRCPHAKDICKKREPELRKVEGALVACHFAEELVDLSPWDFWRTNGG